MTKTRSYKKYAIIAISSIAAVAIILAAILVGMYLFTESQKDIVKVKHKTCHFKIHMSAIDEIGLWFLVSRDLALTS